MDLLQLKPGERLVDILSPGTKQPIGVRVNLCHIADDRLTKLKRRFTDESYRLQRSGKTFKSEMYESNSNELAFAAMLDWEWYNPTGKEGDKDFDKDAHPHLDGKSNPEMTRANVYKIFEILPWFRDQISNEMGDDEAFFPK